MLCDEWRKCCRACLKDVQAINDVGLCVKCRSFENLTEEKREQVQKGARCIDVINKSPKMIPKLALESKYNFEHVVAYDYESETIHDQRNYIQGATNIAWCHRLEGAPRQGARVFDCFNCKTHAYFVEQQYPAIPLIEQLIQCSLNYRGTPTFTLIAHNGTGYDHLHLFKDLAQFEKISNYQIQYSKIRSEGVKTRYAEITFIYKGSRL